ncbi:MAG: preprotein translocase subunit SecE [Deltaproteobacteria bacterium]|nr:preprotein translocase subunit SecE [Deltaproteobacteria bacterium]
MVVAVFLFWLLDKTVALIWRLVADTWTTLPEVDTVSIYITIFSAAAAAALGRYLYVNQKINRLSHEVIAELVKVSWPTREEVSVSTVVVIITSIIASIILGTFDAIWSTITDLIYKV